MTNQGGPWHRGPAPRSGARRLMAFAVVAVVGLALWALSRLFPGTLSDPTNWGYFLYLFTVLAMVSSGFLYSRRIGWGAGLRNVAIWSAVAVVIGLGYIFHHRIADAADDARSELIPGYPATVSADEIVLNENSGGDFFAIGKVDGATVRFLVDTGASEIVLSPDDAERIGIDTARLRFDQTFETANGEGRGAPYRVDEIQVGPIKLFNVWVSVNRTPMHSSLLGMTFLKQMKSFEMKGRKLYLRWR